MDLEKMALRQPLKIRRSYYWRKEPRTLSVSSQTVRRTLQPYLCRLCPSARALFAVLNVMRKLGFYKQKNSRWLLVQIFFLGGLSYTKYTVFKVFPSKIVS